MGAGPVGLVAALRLAARGISFILCEAEPALPEDLRASTLHPPTLDLLDTLGLSAPLHEVGLKCPSWQVRIHETHEHAEFRLELIAAHTSHPWRLQCEQFRLCHLAHDRLRALGADLRLGTRITALSPDEDGVEARFTGPGGPGRLRAHWVIGADGSRSLARQLVDPEFAGLSYPETTILATTTFPFQQHLPGLSHVNYVWWRGGTFSLLRLPALWRCSLYPDADETVEEALHPAAIERKLQRIVSSPDPYPVGQVRPYRVHMRLAARYRAGRLLLAGDAAHLNSPSGGMGMNAGIHDAFALTGALARVIAGGSPALLDAYGEKRRRVAEQEILRQADSNRARMQERDPVLRRSLFEDLRRTAGDPALAIPHLLRSSMITGLRASGEQLYE